MATASEQFAAAVRVVQSMPKDGPFQPSYEMKKRFYGLYKQATIGPCNEPKPAFWEAIKRTKWDAWKQLGDMPKEEAMESYVTDLLKIVETMPISEEVSTFLKAMGPFFEAVNEPLPIREEEKWKFYDGPPPDGTLPINGTPQPQGNGPINGDVHTGSRHDLSDNCLSPSTVANHSGQADGLNAVVVTPTMYKGQHDMGPNGDAHQDESHPFVSDVSGNFTVDSSCDQSGAVGADKSSGTSNNVTVTSESDTDSEEDFCDSMDQPDMNQLPELVKVSAIEEHLQPIREEQVLMTSTPQVKKIIAQAEVHQVNGDYLENGHSTADDNPGDMNGDAPITRRRGGGEVVPEGKGQGGRGQSSDQGGQRGSMGAGRGQDQDTPGRGRTPWSGQGGAPGGRDSSSRANRNPSVDVSEQIVIALQRLQCDMSSVLARLNTLEALALSQAQQSQSERQSSSEHRSQDTPSTSSHQRSWLSWIFPRNLPTRTVFFLLIWPLIVNIILAMWRRRRHRHFRR
ncbi:acyl-CoA-binding domain-containing protein 5-like isoform X2 [Acanthaster planci]|uniref:Acyl-CoA-binding domain-containing protein 5-like isoform X2 n=1 Tax=Acanthaster planci TaxID=133434 RepID=A0A8B7ZSU0_ACAPL|nr:acyl-CoA-binding domain-containing protein 5-like isoform X2 [Acanthaster planci]